MATASRNLYSQNSEFWFLLYGVIWQICHYQEPVKMTLNSAINTQCYTQLRIFLLRLIFLYTIANKIIYTNLKAFSAVKSKHLIKHAKCFNKKSNLVLEDKQVAFGTIALRFVVTTTSTVLRLWLQPKCMNIYGKGMLFYKIERRSIFWIKKKCFCIYYNHI